MSEPTEMDRSLAGSVLLLALATSSPGQEGHLVALGGGGIPEGLPERFLELAGGEAAHLVIFPTASAKADSDDPTSFHTPWKDFPLASIEVLHTRSRAEANTDRFLAPLARATGVWLSGGDQSRLIEAYAGTRVETALQGVLARGGVIGGTSAGASALSQVMIAGGNPVARTTTGLGLWPEAVIDQHFVARNRRQRLEGVLAQHPHLFGVGIDERTAVLFDRSRQRLEVLGASTVTIFPPGSEEPRILANGHVLRLETVGRDE